MSKKGKKRNKLSIIVAGDDGHLYKVGEDIIAQHRMPEDDPLYETAQNLVDAGVSHAVLESHDEVDADDVDYHMINGAHLLNLKAFIKRHRR